MTQKGKRCFAAVFAAAAGLFFAGGIWLCVSWLLPDTLTLTEGEAQSIQLRLPVTAKVEEETAAVLEITSQAALPVEATSVFSFTAEPVSAGTAKVTFYLFDSLPIKTVEANVLPQKELVAVGKTVGVTMDTDGLLVLGTGSVITSSGQAEYPCKDVLQAGDLLLAANGIALENKEQLTELIADGQGKEITFSVDRNGTEKEICVTPVFSGADQGYKIGAWIRDSIQGIGTVTYYDPQTNAFGALGHGVYDVDTGDLMVIKGGRLTSSVVTEVKKGVAGEPGELTGSLDLSTTLGKISSNTEWGIYGEGEQSELFAGESYPVAAESQIHEGEAEIISCVDGDVPKHYQIMIQDVNVYSKDKSKALQIEITDEALLQKTGGIVQGMSGSPIVQDGKIIGALTHVLVNDPTRGYGISIQTMLAVQQQNAA